MLSAAMILIAAVHIAAAMLLLLQLYAATFCHYFSSYAMPLRFSCRHFTLLRDGHCR